MKMPSFLLETIRNDKELQTLLEYGIQQPVQAMCYFHFHPHTQDWLFEEALLRFQKLSLITGHTCKFIVSACTVPHRN